MSDLPHLRLKDPFPQAFTAPPSGPRDKFLPPPRDRREHASKLLADLAKLQLEAADAGLTPGDQTSVVYELDKGSMRVVPSLEDKRTGEELLSVHPQQDNIRATVLARNQEVKAFSRKLRDYSEKDTKSGRPRNEPLIASIEALRLATVDDLWTDSLPLPPPQVQIWWEVWLVHHDGDAATTWHPFHSLAMQSGMEARTRLIEFPDRVVGLVYGSLDQWRQSPRILQSVAELRRARELAGPYVDLSPRDQRELSDDLIDRINWPDSNAPAVCLLDTGVNRGHPLLESALSAGDMHTIDPAWGVADDHTGEHGTAMAGIALYGNLTDLLSSTEEVRLRHRLESVKILSRRADNGPDSYGSISQEAVARAEISAPERKRAISLTVTAKSTDVHYPSSWSAAIDQLAAGGAVTGNPKLLCVASGNLRDQIRGSSFIYPMVSNPDCGIEDPGQAWNALTVGATTDLVAIDDPAFAGYHPIAPVGDLSPTSRTSLPWDPSSRAGWPLKPEVVFEGGNWASDANGVKDKPDDLGLLTTATSQTGALFTITHDTSPATVQAAKMAAEMWSEYPNLWPETVRGLLVHSARWTPAMCQRFRDSSKADVEKRLRCYGYGKPDRLRALYSASNAATLIFEGEIQPYKLDGNRPVSNVMALHALPWPVELLQELGEAEIEMRVTLSYFVEPSPAGRGWTNRYRYPSHQLRFELKRPEETRDKFLSRINRAASDSNEGSQGTTGAGINWVVGTNNRKSGSIHSDLWRGTAAELAEARDLAVLPAMGWWRERPHLGRVNSTARYTLIVSMETPDENVDLYTAIQTEIAAESEISIEVEQ